MMFFMRHFFSHLFSLFSFSCRTLVDFLMNKIPFIVVMYTRRQFSVICNITVTSVFYSAAGPSLKSLFDLVILQPSPSFVVPSFSVLYVRSYCWLRM